MQDYPNGDKDTAFFAHNDTSQKQSLDSDLKLGSSDKCIGLIV